MTWERMGGRGKIVSDDQAAFACEVIKHLARDRGVEVGANTEATTDQSIRVEVMLAGGRASDLEAFREMEMNFEKDFELASGLDLDYSVRGPAERDGVPCFVFGILPKER
jgi:hypothetical protein